jgi:hypothetical protein
MLGQEAVGIARIAKDTGLTRQRSTGSRRPLRPLMAQCYVPPLVVDEPLSSNPVSPRLSGVLNSPSDERYR